MHDIITLRMSAYVLLGVYTEDPARGDALSPVHIKEDQGPSLNLIREVVPSTN